MLSNALNIPQPAIKTYGLKVYEPVGWDGNTATLGTQWIGYVPSDQYPTLQSYIATPSSPLYNQPGLAGQLAAQVDSTHLIDSASNSKTNPAGNSAEQKKASSRKRDIIIGVCVGVGGLLWILVVVWIYKRVKRANERAVNKRLSEHMSMFSGRSGDNPFSDDRRHSGAPSIAASEIDDRPSSFYASPLDNYPAMRHRQVESFYTDQAGMGDTSPTQASYVHSVFGTSWFQNYGATGQAGGSSVAATRMSQNPFDDMYSRTSPTSPRMSQRPQRRSVQKAMISQPTLQANSLEFNEYR
ncbi:hypothetical protein VHUM_00747 [Vanrija humicola]|uniref:Mid2 domain-containing protein n=1 Tax=Vanrija humicola TaxID=5417 RepID=A0A7D8V1Y5_VANHU|nr:hypothetical protein VHUM_00747 [Vanrija humicola]